MKQSELATIGKEHGLSPAMTEAMFWALRYQRANAPVHFRPNGRERCTTLALERRGLAKRASRFGLVFTSTGQRLAERLFA